ncbi:MAG: S8 family serine peptidase [Chloroflexi bacterium]|nr:S8 family serine peptidase [Chloroflexota bacterium]MBP8057080.1 S8 family serine peptidase [Chloroflexota bacterium]
MPASKLTDTCPLCYRHIFAWYKPPFTLAHHISRILKERFPAWNGHGTPCPQCIFEAAQQARLERNNRSLQGQLDAPFPVYLRDQQEILPTPHRINAHPRFTGQGVTVAFLDSGFFPHDDLVRPHNRILCFADATEKVVTEKKLPTTRPQLASWHGTMVSTIGVGNGYTSGGFYRGIAPGANMVLVKTGEKHSHRITEEHIHHSLSWVIANRERFNIRVVNISLGGDHPSTGQMTPLDILVEKAVEQGLVVVAAAGNSGRKLIIPPASASSAITVGGVDDQNSLQRRHRKMFWSNYGHGVHGISKPDLLAPAIWLAAPMLPRTWVHLEAMFLWRLHHVADEAIPLLLSDDPTHQHLARKKRALPLNNVRHAIHQRIREQKYIHPHYQHVDGTSMAAPIISGLVAQLLEALPTLTPEQIKDVLQKTAEPLRAIPFERQGWGVVNGCAAFAAAFRHTLGTIPKPRIPGHTTLTYTDPTAQHVALIGSFNQWNPAGYEFSEEKTGLWHISIPKPSTGVHPYKILVNYHHSIAHPENQSRVEDGYGGFYSLLKIDS